MYINVWKILKFGVKQVNIKQDTSIYLFFGYQRFFLAFDEELSRPSTRLQSGTQGKMDITEATIYSKIEICK